MTTYLFAMHNDKMIRLALNETDDDLWTAIEAQYGGEVYDALSEGDIVGVSEYANRYSWDVAFEPCQIRALIRYLG